MKKLLLLLLFITGTLYAQPPIAQPNDLIVCDSSGDDGLEFFDLTVNQTQILNGLDPANFNLTFHETQTDADLDSNALLNPSFYYSTIPYSQTIYVRVEENANPINYATTSFNLNVNFSPSFVLNDLNICTGQSGVLETGLSIVENTFEWKFNNVLIPNQTTNSLIVNETGSYTVTVTNILTGCISQKTKYVNVSSFINVDFLNDFLIYEDPFDSYAQFNLNLHAQYIIGNDSQYTISYHLSLSDANLGINSIINSDNYTNISNPQTIYVRVEKNFYGCYLIREFDLIVLLGNQIINIPDSGFKNKLLTANSSNELAKDLNGNWSSVDVNNDGNIQFSEALNISYLNLQFGGINALTGLSSFVNLLDLNCSNNSINSLDLSNLTGLQYLNCINNQITQLQLPSNNSLLSLEINGNPISVLNLNSNSNIFRLNIGNTQITSLDIGILNNLTEIHYKEGFTNLLNFNNKSNISYLSISGSTVSSYDFSLFPNLLNLDCHNTNLVNIDLSHNPLLVSLYASYNNSLEILNLKNGGAALTGYQIVFNSADYICVNNNTNFSFINYLISWNGSPVNINSYCSFTPGGDYNTITGITQFDLIGNGCDVNDIPVQYFGIEINLNATSTNSSVFSNGLGNYSIFTNQIGTFGLMPNLENPSYFNVTPNPATVNIPVIDNSTTTQNFCITANGVHPDLEIVIAPITPARPGFDAVYKIVYKNKGNQTLSGNLQFNYNDAVLDYISSSVLPNSQSIGSLIWNYSNLNPFENRSVTITLNVNSPQEIPSVNIDDVLNFSATINPVIGDETTADNTFAYNQTVVGSYDPNDITCIEGDVVSPLYIGEYLHYVINFENTGTYQAENIVVKTEINPADFDISTLRLMEASHNITTRLNGNIIEFIFQSINLDTGGHGNILLKIKTKDELVISDMVSKKADIYFDYNFPIETNFANTTFQVLSNSIITIDNSIGIYPNPTNDFVNIKANSRIISIEIFDVQGRIIQKKITNIENETIDVSGLTNGIYFMMIKTEKGQKVEKLVKK